MITVNGKPLEVAENTSVFDYLEQNRYQINRIAVELNGNIVPKSAYGETILKAGDVMEVVSFVGGG